jgi:peroxiredoxin
MACPVNETPDLDLRGRLVGSPLPCVTLAATDGNSVDLSALTAPRTIIYCYPRTGEPGKPAPTGWDVIPGARGCTPQACTFRDHHRELVGLQAEVLGLSTQSTLYQQEMVSRLHLPFPVLSDEQLQLADALGLPTFEVDGMRLIKRLTLIARAGRIEEVFYPILQPERSAEDVVDWLKAHPLPR